LLLDDVIFGITETTIAARTSI